VTAVLVGPDGTPQRRPQRPTDPSRNRFKKSRRSG